MNEDFEVDKRELAQQMIDEIRKGKHTEVLILVGKDSTEPMCIFSGAKDLFREIGVLYNCLDELKKTIESRYPASVLYAKNFLELEDSTEIDINK